MDWTSTGELQTLCSLLIWCINLKDDTCQNLEKNQLIRDLIQGVQRSAEVDAPGCVNAVGKLGKKWYATAVIKFTKPGAPTLADLCNRCQWKGVTRLRESHLFCVCKFKYHVHKLLPHPVDSTKCATGHVMSLPIPRDPVCCLQDLLSTVRLNIIQARTNHVPMKPNTWWWSRIPMHTGNTH